VPIAAGAAAVGAATGSVILAVGVGTIASGNTNVILNNTQRAATDIVNGKTVTTESIENDFEENFKSDMEYGIIGYGIGKTFSSIGKAGWSPHEFIGRPPVFGEPLLSTPMGGVTNLLTPHPAQNILTGSASTLAQAISNSTLIAYWRRHRFEDK